MPDPVSYPILHLKLDSCQYILFEMFFNDMSVVVYSCKVVPVAPLDGNLLDLFDKDLVATVTYVILVP